MAFLEIKDIRKKFGDTSVLNGVSMDIEKGMIATVIGDSGNGKTTLLRCLNELETIDSGTVSIDGKQVLPKLQKKEKSRFGLVFQGFNLFPQYNALQNVTLALDNQIKYLKKQEEYKNISVKELKKKNEELAIRLLERMGLGDKMRNYPCELSGGQCQRVAIARALALNPEILCFDEPTSALDPKLTVEVSNVILELKKQGNTMIIVTHDMTFAKLVSDVVYFMSKGQVIEYGTKEEIFGFPKSKELISFFANEEKGE